MAARNFEVRRVAIYMLGRMNAPHDVENGVTSGFARFLCFQKYVGILRFNETNITRECTARFVRAPQESSGCNATVFQIFPVCNFYLWPRPAASTFCDYLINV